MCVSSRPGSTASTPRRAACWKRPAGPCPIRRVADRRGHLSPLFEAAVAASGAVAAHPHRRQGRAHYARRRRQDVEQGPRRQAVRAAIEDSDGAQQTVLARAVIDASGTWGMTNPLGASAWTAKASAGSRIASRTACPMCSAAQRARYADKRIAVVGARLQRRSTFCSTSPSFAECCKHKDYLGSAAERT